MCQYSDECIHHYGCYNDATPYVLCRYSNECILQYECPYGATRYELFF